MCLYPTLIRNKRYIPNKKNKGRPPKCNDKRKLLVPIGCQECIECRNQKGRAWSVRLQEEIRTNKKGQFVTLTFSNESIKALKKECNGLEGYELDNQIATLATRRFLERWRKKHGESVKHWLTTELGHNGTENIHLHGIIFTTNKKDINEIWQYGYTWIGDYVNERTINYVIKYTTKMDLQHLEYKPKILTSKGIGANYTKRPDARLNEYKKEETNETYSTRQGIKINLPIYYRNKIYTEEQRENLWTQKLDKQERWVRGIKIKTDTPKGIEQYYKALQYYQAQNKRLGYGTGEKNWQREQYEHERRKLLHEKRTRTDTDNTSNEESEVLVRRRTNKANRQFERIAARLRKIH